MFGTLIFVRLICRYALVMGSQSATSAGAFSCWYIPPLVSTLFPKHSSLQQSSFYFFLLQCSHSRLTAPTHRSFNHTPASLLLHIVLQSYSWLLIQHHSPTILEPYWSNTLCNGHMEFLIKHIMLQLYSGHNSPAHSASIIPHYSTNNTPPSLLLYTMF